MAEFVSNPSPLIRGDFQRGPHRLRAGVDRVIDNRGGLPRVNLGARRGMHRIGRAAPTRLVQSGQNLPTDTSAHASSSCRQFQTSCGLVLLGMNIRICSRLHSSAQLISGLSRSRRDSARLDTFGTTKRAARGKALQMSDWVTALIVMLVWAFDGTC